MSLRSTSQTWGSVTRTFHWISALVVLGLLSHGWWMTHLAQRPDRQWNYATHAMIAMYFAIFLALRIVWRSADPSPRPISGGVIWQVIASRWTHLVMYVLLVSQIVTGFLMWSKRTQRFAPATADVWNFHFFGLFDMSHVGKAGNLAIAEYWEDQHVFISHLLEILIAAHILAALYHQFVARDASLRRMISGRIDPLQDRAQHGRTAQASARPRAKQEA